MPIDLTIQPKIAEHDLKVLSRLTAEFDRKIERKEPLTPKEVIALGTNLWEALIRSFDGGMDRLLAVAAQASAVPTYIRLVIESNEPKVLALPWELTFHADPRLGFLSRNSAFTFSRRPQSPDPAPPNLPGLPLRILLFISSPEDLDPEKSRLDFETEESFLFQQLDAAIAAGKLEIDVAEDGALETLQDRLEHNVYHVVHLSMHGKMDDGKALLQFEEPHTGLHREVTPEQLISLWQKSGRSVPCFFVSACQSALPDTQRAVPDLASKLLEAGVPHVIGMRRSVADSAATHFAGNFYHALSAGKDIDQAMAEARQALSPDDASQQWAIPVLYSRKRTLAVADPAKPFQPQPRQPLRHIQIGDLSFDQDGFIGRRAAIRRHFRDWSSGKTPHLLFCGIGGVGKTTLAGHFAIRLRRQQPRLRTFAFGPPFAPQAMEEQLRPVFVEYAAKTDLDKLKQLDEPLDRLWLIITAINEQGPLLFIFDNLESCLDLKTREFLPVHRAIEQLIGNILQSNSPVWMLITCRYPIFGDRLKLATLAELRDASPGDILRFMNDKKRWTWPDTISSDDKKEIYKTFGGNFRSIEWLAGLLAGKRVEAWEKIHKRAASLMPPKKVEGTERQIVLEAMRRDLLFDELVALLTPGEKLLLQRLRLETRQVFTDALHALWDAAETIESAITHLTDYRLLETGYFSSLSLPTYRVPPLVAELLARDSLPGNQQADTHARLARYWRHVGAHVTRYVSDDFAAFEHFSAAGLHDEADTMITGVCGHFYRYSEFGRVVALLSEVVKRRGKDTPWRVWNLLGMSLHSLGQYAGALQCHQAAEYKVEHAGSPDAKASLGTTLNNISQIFKARGDYGKALEYLEKSLSIRREIGDRAGMIPTLHNMAHIHLQNRQIQQAVEEFGSALQIAIETNRPYDIIDESRDLGNLLCRIGQKAQGLPLLQQALALGKQLGHPQTAQVEDMLKALS